MKHLFLFIYLIINSCQAQKATDYENKVYKLLNEVFERKSENSSSNNAYININHNLKDSAKNLDDEILKKLLVNANSKNNIYLPKDILDDKKWKQTNTDFLISTFDQNKISIPNLIFFKNDNMPNNKIYLKNINAVLFYNHYAILSIEIQPGFNSISLFKLEHEKYNRITTITNPPLVYE